MTEKHECNRPSINVQVMKGKPMGILLKYLGLQKCSLAIGMFTLLGGNLAQFVVPLLIGRVVDSMKTGDWETINESCI